MVERIRACVVLAGGAAASSRRSSRWSRARCLVIALLFVLVNLVTDRVYRSTRGCARHDGPRHHPAVAVAPARSRVPLWRRVLRSRSGLVGAALDVVAVAAALAALLGLTPYDPVSQRPADRFQRPARRYSAGNDQSLGHPVAGHGGAGTCPGGGHGGRHRGRGGDRGRRGGAVASQPPEPCAGRRTCCSRSSLPAARSRSRRRSPATGSRSRSPSPSSTCPSSSGRAGPCACAARRGSSGLTVLGSPRPILLRTPPAIAPIIIVQVTLALSWAVLTEASLSFLGLGTPPRPRRWALDDPRRQRRWSPLPVTMLAPGAMLVVFVVGLNLLGDGLRDALDSARGDRRMSARPTARAPEALEALVTERADPRYAHLDEASVASWRGS
ncbi:MAG: ABC transporter permease subunit [Chloroflexota bacterium]